MSRNFKNNSNSKPVEKYCKVCHDAGKSEAEFRSHFTRESREPSAKVTCPTLLALECRYCYKNGHTVKYCSLLKESEKAKKREVASARRIENTKNVDPKLKSKQAPNVFACLDEDSDDEEKKNVSNHKSVVKLEVKEDFPELCAPAKRVSTTSSSTSNYAAALSLVSRGNQLPEPKFVAVEFPVLQKKHVSSETTAPWSSCSQELASKMDWAARYSDSDSDEEEEEEFLVKVEQYQKYADDDYNSDW
jgi:hypothetical protein